MGEPTCIDLKQRFGSRYRIGWEADGKTKSQWAKEDWPWLMELRCRHGKIYPQGDETLCAVSDRQNIRLKLRALPCVLRTKGDVEVVVYFHVKDIDQVLALLRPYRRRRLSEAHKQALAASNVGHRFKAKGETHASGVALQPPESTQTAPNVVGST